MIVSMLMSRDVETVHATAPISVAAERMSRRQIRHLPVMAREADTELVGIVSATDLQHAYPPKVNPFAVLHDLPPGYDVPVGTIMHRDVATTTPTSPVESAARVMRDRKIGAMPVVQDGQLVGILTESDVFGALVDMLWTSSPGSRISFTIGPDEDCFALLTRLALPRGLRVSLMSPAQSGTQGICVVRVSGTGEAKFVEALWNTGHRVLSVLHLDART